MTFDDYYDAYFRSIMVVKAQSKEGDGQVISLDSIMNSSQFIAFYFTAANKHLDLTGRLDEMVKKRNAKKEENSKSSPARLRRLFSLKKKKKKVSEGDSVNLSVVLVDTDHIPTSDCSNVSFANWYIYIPGEPLIKSRLLRSLGFDVPPSIIILDCSSRTVVTGQGRRLLADDPLGNNFPWWQPSADDLLKGELVRRKDDKTETIDAKDLNVAVKALFFGAYWCPPCRPLVKQLSSVYNRLKEKKCSFEMIYCSSDRSQEFFDQFIEQQPWLAFAFDPTKTMALARMLNICGIPSIILLDANNRIISRHGRSVMLDDPDGQNFPWGPKPLYELNENTVVRLRDEPSLILFTEGGPGDVDFSLNILDGVSKQLFEERIQLDKWREEEKEKKAEERENNENGNALSKSNSAEECSQSTSGSIDSAAVAAAVPVDPLQILYTGEDPICDHILETIIGLEDVELPLICIVDGLAGQYAICDQPDVSQEVIEKFVSDYRTGRVDWTPLPDIKNSSKHVGGIPTSMIEQALMEQSPSQNSLGKEDHSTI